MIIILQKDVFVSYQGNNLIMIKILRLRGIQVLLSVCVHAYICSPQCAFYVNKFCIGSLVNVAMWKISKREI